MDAFRSGRTIEQEHKDDQSFEGLVKSAEAALDLRVAKESGKSNPLLQAYPTKDLRAYEDLCYHFIRSRRGMTSSVQVADYYELTKEEGACLLTRVSKRFPAVELTVYAKV